MQRRKPQHDYAKARKLRAEMTLPEVLLWKQLRNQPMGVKFRRQHPVGRYVLDFYCPSAKLGFEVDGMSHDMGDRSEQDIARDDWLLTQGISVIRIPASEVLKSAETVAASIVARCGVRS